jgi:hypothetical protein
LAQIEKLLEASRLTDCEADCTTNHLTLKNGELYDTAVTPTFCDQFKKECEELELQTLTVSMESVGGNKAGSLGRLSAQGLHGSGRAGLLHPALEIMDSPGGGRCCG